MRDNRTGAPRRPPRWLMMALIACLFASCQFLGLDMYPPELQSASTSCDLPALVAQKTGNTLDYVKEIRQLSSGTTSLLFVLCATDFDNVVMVLDPETLAYRSHKTAVSMPFGLDAAGYFRAGVEGYNPSADSWTSAIAFPVSSYSSLLFSPVDLIHNVLLNASNNTLSVMAAANPWPATAPSASTADISSDSSSNWRIEDAAAGTSETRFLLRRDSDGMTYYINYAGSPYALWTDVDTNMTTTSFLENTTTAQKSTFYSKENCSWLLADCIVHVENNMERRITRRSLSDGSVIDSHLIDSNWKDSAYFEPTGERWYYYDTRVSKLCVLRTWW